MERPECLHQDRLKRCWVDAPALQDADGLEAIVSRHGETDGMHWDAERLREVREDGWFRRHEAELIEEAGRKRAQVEKRRRDAARAELLHFTYWHKCPTCGDEMTSREFETVKVLECATCEGFFFDRGGLEKLLLRHDSQRRGFFRRLPGFSGE